MRKGLLRASAALIVVAAVLAVGITPSHARCLAADVIVHRTGQPDQPVVTDGQCLVPTPFGAYLRVEHDVRLPTPSGTPSGAYVEVWVPID